MSGQNAEDTAEYIIRASSLSGWNDCPRRNFANAYKHLVKNAGYDLRERGKLVSGAFGTSVHAAAAHAMRQKLSNLRVDEDDLNDVCVAKFDEEIADGVSWDQSSKNRENAIKQMKACIASYVYDVLPSIKDVESFERLDLAMVKTDKNLSGHADLVTKTSIRDIKTGRSGDGCHGQMGGYALLQLANTDKLPDELIVDHIPRSAVTKPYPGAVAIKYDVRVCVAEAATMIDIISRTIDEFVKKPGPILIPANTMSILCGEKYCTAFGTDYCELSKKVS